MTTSLLPFLLVSSALQGHCTSQETFSHQVFPSSLLLLNGRGFSLQMLLSILSQPLQSAVFTALATEGCVPGCFKIGKQAALIHRIEFALFSSAMWRNGVKNFFLNPILIFSFPFQVCQVKFISVPVPTVTRVKLAFLFALLGFHFSTSLSKINCAPHVFKFHYRDLT